MLSERYRPTTWDAFIGQPIIDEIRQACGDPWLFADCGERWLYESDGIARLWHDQRGLRHGPCIRLRGLCD